MRMKNMKSILIIGLLLTFVLNINAQTIDFNFETKDYNGDVKLLTERLDQSKNHLILFSAFWCLPCVKQLDDVYSKNIDLYRDLYNLELIILNDDYYDQTNIALNKIKEKQWYFNQYLTDDIFGDLAVTSIPRYYLVLAGETTGERVYSSNFLNKLETYYIENGHTSPFFTKNTQIIASEDCSDISVSTYGETDSEMYLGKEYHNINGQYYRSGIQNKNIYRYDPLIHEEVLVFDFYLDKCSAFTLTDHEGDAMLLTIETITTEDDVITIETNQTIETDCGEDIPFIISSKYGSNAGLVFDIEDNEIKSKLVCHTQGDEVLYSSDDLSIYCDPVNTEEEDFSSNLSLTNNPGNGRFEVVGSDDFTIEIRNVNGKKVKYHSQNGSVDISNYSAGIYMVYEVTSSAQVLIGRYVKR